VPTDPAHAPPTAVASLDFSVPAETVWGYRLDFANLSQYNPDVSDVERVCDGAADGVGGVCGPGARYAFRLADARQPGLSHPVELWTVDVVEPTLVAAGMDGGNEAYEEFVVHRRDDGGCDVELTLWVTLPDGLPDDAVAAAAAGSLEQITKELRLMKQILERRAGVPSAP
jgi:Polyketide cyclase / dehydrase and lipid transport